MHLYSFKELSEMAVLFIFMLMRILIFVFEKGLLNEKE